MVLRFLKTDRVFEVERPPLLGDLEYAVCVLHLRIRLIGHVLEFVCVQVNARMPEKKRELSEKLRNEFSRCHVSNAIMRTVDGGSIKIFDPSGDVADNLCKYGFNLSTIFGTCRAEVGLCVHDVNFTFSSGR